MQYFKVFMEFFRYYSTGTTQKIWCVDVFIHVCFIQVTMCGALNALTRYGHFSIHFTPSWITQQISVGKYAHRGAWACRERQTMFQIVTWTKQTWIIHQCTKKFTERLSLLLCPLTVDTTSVNKNGRRSWVPRCRAHLPLYLGYKMRQGIVWAAWECGLERWGLFFLPEDKNFYYFYESAGACM